MSQLSRPYQIALVALTLLVMVWFVALRGHNGSPAASSSSAAAPAPSTSQTSSTYQGSAPGVSGLTRAIAKAHGAAAVAQKNAHEVTSKSAQVSGEASSAGTASTSAHGTGAHSSGASATSSTASTSASSGASKGSTATSTTTSKSSTSGKANSGAAAKSAAKPSREGVLKHELADHKIVLLMFWNPKSSDDQEVRAQLHDLSRRDGRVAVHLALPLNVGDFGGFTRGVQILQTPTVMVIGSKGQATTLTGLTDARSIQQAIGDALQGGAGKVQTAKLTAWVHGSSRSGYIGRANALCHKPLKVVFGEGTVRKALTSFHSFEVSLLNPFTRKLAALSPPAADSGHIDRLLGLFRRSGGSVDQALSAVGAGHGLQARTLLLEAQAQLDQATHGLADYGITACFRNQ